MKIIILGAGQVGGTLAEQLADEQNEITVVDSQATTLRALQERLDIRTVHGDAAIPPPYSMRVRKMPTCSLQSPTQTRSI